MARRSQPFTHAAMEASSADFARARVSLVACGGRGRRNTTVLRHSVLGERWISELDDRRHCTNIDFEIRIGNL